MESFEQFVTHYRTELYEKGQTILLKDAIPEGVYVIESGLVKTYTITAGGDERLISLDTKGEDFPIGYAFGLIDRAQYFYEAYTRCKLRVIPRGEFMAHMRRNIDSLQRRHAHLTALLLATLSRVNALEQPRARDKIAATLLYMTDRIGVRMRTPNTRRLPVTQQEIANWLGLTRETTGTELKKLELRNILTHSRKNYVLYIERLRRYLDGNH